MGSETTDWGAGHYCMMVVSRRGQWIVIWVQSWIATFSWDNISTQKNPRQANYGYLDRSIWQTFSQKLRREPCHLKENKLTVFIANDKVKLSSEIWNFGKLLSTTVILTLSQYLKTFLMRLMMMWIKCDFGGYCVRKCVNICNICIIQWTNIF